MKKEIMLVEKNEKLSEYNYKATPKINNIELNDFTFDIYINYLQKFKLKKTWDFILQLISNKTIEELNNSFLKFDNLGELYEIGLAETNKIDKKEMGKYYTPQDVSTIMAELLLENNNIENIVDVAAGTGNLIIEVIKQIKEKQLFNITNFIKEKRLWLYDIDSIALNICITKIEILLQEKIGSYINIISRDFLNKKTILPKNCSVITNPPYSVLKKFKSTWKKTEILLESKDLYAAFIDKITDYCENAVIVSPQSFLVSKKFSKLRIKLGSNYYGEIFAFDNVPGALFNGKKHGIFNSNSSNGVRAAITSIKKNGHKGFKLSHLIRFTSNQRSEVMRLEFLRSKLGKKIQDLKTPPIKSFKELENFAYNIINENHLHIENLLELNPAKQKKELKINVSSSARYFIVASKKDLDRNGRFEVYANTLQNFNLLYALLNSSYIYMWYRFFDGGILFTKSNLLKIPIKKELIKNKNKLKNIVLKMINDETKFLTYKKNAGKKQESIKFPVEYRKEINNLIFFEYAELFTLLHNNSEQNI